MAYDIYNIKQGKWTTIGWGIGVGRKLHWKVASEKECRWRRIAFAPWGGKFVKSRSAWIGLWGVIQIKSPEDTQAASSFNSEDLDLLPF